MGDDGWLEYAWSSSDSFNGFVSRSFLSLVVVCGVVQYVNCLGEVVSLVSLVLTLTLTLTLTSCRSS